MNECCKDNKNIIDYLDKKKLCFICGNLIDQVDNVSSYVTEEEYYTKEINNFLSLIQRRTPLKKIFACLIIEKNIDFSELQNKTNIDTIQIRNNLRVLREYKLIETTNNLDRKNTKTISLITSSQIMQRLNKNEIKEISVFKSQ